MPAVFSEDIKEISFDEFCCKNWVESSLETNEELIRSYLSVIPEIIKNELTDRQKEVLSLFMKGFNGSQIARMLEINRSTVSRILAAAIETLRNRLGYIKMAFYKFDWSV